MRDEDAIEKIRSRLKTQGGEGAQAAVAILFRNVGGLELLFVKRASIPNDPWSGDMAFPGGKRIPEDGDLIETVFREVREETGVDLGKTSFLGMMETIHSTVRPEMGVLPIVFLVGESPNIRLNYELSSYLWVPLGELKGSRGREIVKELDVPVFHVEGEVVWGLTYRMLEKLFELVEGD
ncbi:MAG: CoA pyrophosphatase [Candidatus Bathyarchaeota archaeon]|nr:CoA pyrophosphatase [Candidatus Bathyarchaeota archaeon]